MNLNNAKLSLKSGLLWTSINSSSVLLVQFFSIIILARLLNPEDFAIIGIVSFFITLSNLFIDSGMGGALVVKKDVGDVDLSTLFLYNLVISILLYTVIFFSSEYIESFYEKDGLADILRVISLVLLISSFGKIQNTILTKKLKFKALAIVSFSASLISLVIAIVLAYSKFGVWALVYQSVSYAFFTVVLQFYFNRFVPKLQFSYQSFKEQWQFGFNLFLSSALQTIYSNIFLLVFPKVSNLNFSGLYFQANKIHQIPQSVISSIVQSVSFPILSKLTDKNEFKGLVRYISRSTYLISFFLFFFLFIESKQIIEVALGNKWMEANEILRLLSFSGIGFVILSVHRSVLKSISETKAILFLDISRFIIGLFVLFISLNFDQYIIVKGLVFSVLASSVISIIFLSKFSEYSLFEQISDLLICFLISFLVVIFYMVFNYIFSILFISNIFPILLLIYFLLSLSAFLLYKKFLLSR